MNYKHISVMPEEVIEYLNIDPDGIYVDCTLGGAGHTKLILERLSASGRVIGFDRDETAIENARRTVNDSRLILVNENFRNIASALNRLGIDEVSGILFDFGVSSHQIDTPERGFSYSVDAPLDMRMDVRESVTAATILNTYSEQELKDIFKSYGEEKHSGLYAKKIVAKRDETPFESTMQLVTFINSVCPSKAPAEKSATVRRIFQALRTATNDELGSITEAIEASVDKLKSGGRLVIIAFQSLETSTAKQAFNKFLDPCKCSKRYPCVCGKKPTAKLITKKPVLPTQAEIDSNIRAHSAVLRAIEKL